MLITAIKHNFKDIINLINSEDNNKKILFVDDSTLKIIDYFSASELQGLNISSNSHINTLLDDLNDHNDQIKMPYCVIYFLTKEVSIDILSTITNPRIQYLGNKYLITNNINVVNDKFNKTYYMCTINTIFNENTFTCRFESNDLFGCDNRTSYQTSCTTINLVCDILKVQNKLFPQIYSIQHPLLTNDTQKYNKLHLTNSKTNALVIVQSRACLSYNLFAHNLSHFSIVYNYMQYTYDKLKNNKYFLKYCFNTVDDLENIIKNVILAKFNTKYRMIIKLETDKIPPTQMPHNIIKIIDKYNKEKASIKSYVDSVKECVNEINLRNLTGLHYLESKIIGKTINVNNFKPILLHNKGLYDKYDIYCLVVLVILIYQNYDILLHKISKHSGVAITEEIIAKCLNILYNLNSNLVPNSDLNSNCNKNDKLIEDYFSYGKVSNIDHNCLNIPYANSLKQYHDFKKPFVCGNVYILYIDGNITTNDLIYVNNLRDNYKQRILLGGTSIINIMDFVRNIFN